MAIFFPDRHLNQNKARFMAAALFSFLAGYSNSGSAGECAVWGDVGDWPPYAIEILQEQDIVRGQQAQAHTIAARTMIVRNVEQPADITDTACLDGLHGIDVNIFSASIVDSWGLLYQAVIDSLRNFACAFAVTFYNAKLSQGLDSANAFVQEYIDRAKNKAMEDLGMPAGFLDQFDFTLGPKEQTSDSDGNYRVRSERSQYSFVEEQGVGWLEDRLNNLGSSIWEDYDPSLFNERQAESKRARADVIQAAREAGEVPFGGKLVPTSKDDWRAIGSHLSWSGMTEGMAAVSTSIMVDLREFGLGQTSGLSDHALRQPISFAIDCMGASLGRSGQSVPGCFDD